MNVLGKIFDKENEVKEDFCVYDQESDNHITLRNWLNGEKII